jgi:hypothetical protein
MFVATRPVGEAGVRCREGAASDDQGLIEYGEWCVPARYTIGYEYSV